MKGVFNVLHLAAYLTIDLYRVHKVPALERRRDPAGFIDRQRSSLPIIPNMGEKGGREHYVVDPTLTGNFPGYGPFKHFLAPSGRKVQDVVNKDARRLRRERFVELEGTNIVVPSEMVCIRTKWNELEHFMVNSHDIGLAIRRHAQLQAEPVDGEIAGNNLVQDTPFEADDNAPAAPVEVQNESTDESIFRKSFPHGWHTVPAEVGGRSHGLNAIVESWRHQYPALAPIELRDLQWASARADYGARDGAYTFKELANIFNIYIQGRTKRKFELQMYDESENIYVSSRNDAKADCLWIYLERGGADFRALHPLSYREGQVMSKVQINAFRVLQTTRDQWSRFTGSAADFPDYEAYFKVRIPRLKSFVGETSDATKHISKELLVWLADYLRLFEATSHVKEMARTLGGWWTAFMNWAKRAAKETGEALLRQCRRMTYQNMYDSVQQGADWAQRHHTSLGLWFAGNLFLGYRGFFRDVRDWEKTDWVSLGIMEVLAYIALQWLEGNNGLWNFLKHSVVAFWNFLKASTYAVGRFCRDKFNGARDLTYRAAVSIFTTLCDLRLILSIVLVGSLVSLLAWVFRKQLLVTGNIVRDVAVTTGNGMWRFIRTVLLRGLAAFFTHPITQLCALYGLIPLFVIGTAWYLMRKYKVNPFTWLLGLSLSSLPRPDRERTVDTLVKQVAKVQRPWDSFKATVERAFMEVLDAGRRFFAAIGRFFVALGNWFVQLFTNTSGALATAYRSTLNAIVWAYRFTLSCIAVTYRFILTVIAVTYRFILNSFIWLGSSIKAAFFWTIRTIGDIISATVKILTDMLDSLVDLPWHYLIYWIGLVSAIAVGVWLALRFGVYPYLNTNGKGGFLPSLGKLIAGIMEHYERLRQEQNEEMLQQAMEKMEGMIRGLQPSKPLKWFW